MTHLKQYNSCYININISPTVNIQVSRYVGIYLHVCYWELCERIWNLALSLWKTNKTNRFLILFLKQLD